MSDQKVRTDRSPLWRISFSAGHSFQRLGNNPLKLSVCTAKFIGGPFFNGIHRLGIYTQNKTLD